jgi:restriction system protein
MLNHLRRNPKVTWEQYERHVRDFLSASSEKVKVNVTGKRTLDIEGQEYEVDATAELEMLGGIRVMCIIECKRHGRPVSRDLVIALHGKTQHLGAHKSILFSTSGFQRGAVDYARRFGVALVKLADGRVTVVTKSEDTPETPPDFLPELVCIWRPAPNTCALVTPAYSESFRTWLLAPTPTPSDAEPADDPRPDLDAPLDSEESE